MTDKQFLDLLSPEEIWLRQNVPEKLHQMREAERNRLVQAGDPQQLAKWEAKVAQIDDAWEKHKDSIPKVRLWNEPPPAKELPTRTSTNELAEGEAGDVAERLQSENVQLKNNLLKQQQKPELEP